MDLESNVRRRKVGNMSELFPSQEHDVEPSRKTLLNPPSLEKKQSSNGNEDEKEESCCEQYFFSFKAIILITLLVFFFLEVYHDPALENKGSALDKVTYKMKSMQSDISKYLVGAEDKEKKPVEVTPEEKVEKSSASSVEEKSTTPAAEQKSATRAAEQKEKKIDKFNPDAVIQMSAETQISCVKRRAFWMRKYKHTEEEATKLIMQLYPECVKGD